MSETATTRGRPRRPPFRNAHGDVFCHACRRWLAPREFYRNTHSGNERRPCKACNKRRASDEWARRYGTDPVYTARQRASVRARHRRRRAEARAERAARRTHAMTLVARLAAAGWSQRRIAAALATSRSLIVSWARGRVTPTARRYADLRRLAAAVSTEETAP